MQIIGTAKCRVTKKCRLWFDQRGIPYHFLDCRKKPLSLGELKAVAAGRSWHDLIDRDSAAWKKHQLEWKDFDPREEIIEHQELLITPILRDGPEVVIGSDPPGWQRIADKHRNTHA